MNVLLGDEATNAITEKIIGCAFRVRDKLKCGFLEKVYENAMVIELEKAGLRVEQQAPVPVSATDKRVCLLLNFWTRVQIKRYLGQDDQVEVDAKTAANILTGSSGNAGV